MKPHTDNGTRYVAGLARRLDANQDDLVRSLTEPHHAGPVVAETLGAQRRIVSKLPAHQPDEQKPYGRGRIVWNRAYSFQPHGPSYLDPIPDPEVGR